jgi:hypothetical protein
LFFCCFWFQSYAGVKWFCSLDVFFFFFSFRGGFLCLFLLVYSIFCVGVVGV